MAQILKFARRRESLDPVALEILGVAYDKAIAALHGKASKIVCELIADRIMDAGIRGERDADALHAFALRGM